MPEEFNEKVQLAPAWFTVNVWVAMVTVPLWLEPVLGATITVTAPFPFPEVGPEKVIQGYSGFLVAVHGHAALEAMIATGPLPPPATTLELEGWRVNWQLVPN